MSRAGCVLAFDFGGTKFGLATAASDGQILKRRVLRVRPGEGAQVAIGRAIAEGKQLIESTPSEGALRAVGASSMGITEENRVRLAPNIPGWEELAIPALLRTAFGVPVHVLNDVKAATLAELRWGALRNVKEGIYINLGTGIAAGLVVGGRLVSGAHGAAGEIGYCLKRPEEPAGVADGRAPLEEWVAGAGLRQRAEDELGRRLSGLDLLRLARHDSAARRLLDEAEAQIVFQLTNLAIAIDAERVVLGGGLFGNKRRLIDRLCTSVRQFSPFPPEVALASYMHDAGLVGAVALALGGARDVP